MRKHLLVSLLCLLLATGTLVWGLSPLDSPKAQVKEVTVALLLDTDIGTGALQMKQGAKLAAKEYKVELTTASPDSLGGGATQAQLMTQLLGQGIKALVLVPAKGEDLSEPMAQAALKGVPVLALGEAPQTGGTACVISANHEEAGALAAKALLSRISPSAFILLVTGDESDAASKLRLSGAMNILSGSQGIAVRQASVAGSTAEDIVKLLSGQPDLNGVLVLTGDATEAFALAMAHLPEHIPLVGMDCGQNRNLYLENGQVDAMVLGMPFAMGYLGVQFAMNSLNGKTLPPAYYTESRTIDKENMYLPENQKLAFPMLQ